MIVSDARCSRLAGGRHGLVELSTDEGLTGRAPCAAAVAVQAAEMARDRLLGRDPRAVSSLWDSLCKTNPDGPPAAAEARAALDIACWDLKSRGNGEPLWKTLGGGAPDAVAYASWAVPPDGETRAAESFPPLAADGGFHRGLLRLGDDPASDVGLLTRMSDALSRQGAPVELMVDLGHGWPNDARQRIRLLEREFDIAWAKGVARPGDYRGCKRVGRAISAAVCAGRELGSEAEFLPYLNSYAANVIEIDLLRLGVTGALRVAEAAYGYEIPVVLADTPCNLGIHLASALPNFMGLEITDCENAPEGLVSATRIADGRARAGDRPGLGIEGAENS